MQGRPVAIVVGARSGAGREVAALLEKKGYLVVATSRSTKGFASLDVQDQASVDDLIQNVVAKHGRIDVLVNNAGYFLSGSIEAVPVHDATTQFNTNYFGAVRMAQGVLPHMRAAGAGRIVNVGSVLGFLPFPFAAHYAASKAALRAFSEALDHEVRSFGIRSILIEPGNMKSGFDAAAVQHADKDPAYSAARGGYDDAWAAARAQADDPSVVVDAVWAAVSEANPKLRYPVGKGAGFLNFARHKLPARAFDRSMRKQFKLPAV